MIPQHVAFAAAGLVLRQLGRAAACSGLGLLNGAAPLSAGGAPWPQQPHKSSSSSSSSTSSNSMHNSSSRQLASGGATASPPPAARRALSSSAEPEPVLRRRPAPREAVVGQPAHATHPELLAPGELTPGIAAREYAERRNRLVATMPAGAVAVVPAAATAYVTGVIPHPYRQDADFLYLTGLQQHGVAVVTGGGGAGGAARFELFLPEPDRERERWDGAWVGAAAAVEHFGADAAHSLHALPARLQALAGCGVAGGGAGSAPAALLFDADRVSGYHYGPVRAAVEGAAAAAAAAAASRRAPGGGSGAQRGSSSTSSGSAAAARIQPLRPLMHRLRWLKSPAELRLMRQSAQIASDAMRRCIGASRPGVAESAIAATFEYECRMAGAARCAYPSVVAGGADATAIHYGRNDKRVAAGDLLLMDAGCEYAGYASDVTRTWPVSGRFTGPQRAVYEAVLDARRRVLEAVRPGDTLWRLHTLSVRLLSEALVALGVLPGMSADAVQAQHYREFYCHSVGHYLGLDVHDCAAVGPHAPLEPGAVLAIEPGLYIPPDPSRYGALAGIGVRIEDDVEVVAGGARVLSAGLPVEPAEVEELVGSLLDGGGSGSGSSSSISVRR